VSSLDLPQTIDTTATTWWLYLLQCQDGRTYAGIAIDVEARFQAHISGKGGKFTRANKPTGILGTQPFATKSAALKAEHALKQLRKAEKLAWARQRVAAYSSPNSTKNTET
jgi:putative endonuclease